jgi:hypothetical protein
VSRALQEKLVAQGGIRLPSSPVSGYGMKSDASGSASWASLSRADWLMWCARDGQCIGRANLDATNIDLATVLVTPTNLGLGAHGDTLVWVDATNQIGCSKTDGSGYTHKLITGLNAVAGVCTDGTYIYFTQGGTDHNDIKRANLDGTAVTLLFNDAPGAVQHSPAGICTDGVHLYWANTTQPSIGRSLLDGTSGNADFLSQTGGNWGSHTSAGNQVAVDSNYIWCTQESSVSPALGRANLDGSGWQPSFITGFAAGSMPYGIASDGTYVYWSEYTANGGTIGRAKVDGTSVNHSFITGINGVGPLCLALAAL